jgi:hypothetical protein
MNNINIQYINDVPGHTFSSLDIYTFFYYRGILLYKIGELKAVQVANGQLVIPNNDEVYLVELDIKVKFI